MKYDKKILENLILEQNIPYSQIGKMFGVSGAAIKKAAKGLDIKLPKRRKINPKENFSHKSEKHKLKSLVNQVSEEMFIEIINKSYSWQEIGFQLGYKSRVLSPNIKNSILERCMKLGISHTLEVQNGVGNKTKGELFKLRKNWQSASSSIRKDARSRYWSLQPDRCCAICGYTHHTEVAHIIPVSDFNDDTLISEINSISNLIGLCPNHHWELDNGILII